MMGGMWTAMKALKSAKMLIIGLAAIAGSGALLYVVHSLKASGAAEVVQESQAAVDRVEEKRDDIEDRFIEYLIEEGKRRETRDEELMGLLRYWSERAEDTQPTGRVVQPGDIIRLDPDVYNEHGELIFEDDEDD